MSATSDLINGYQYAYDARGNISTETTTASGSVLSYTYDEQNQLTTVKNGSGTTLYSYSYDTMGNIRSKTDGSVTHLYTYGNPQWADLLTAYDGHTITYDGSGNPLSYYNGADYTFTWEQGRQLASVTKGNKTASYTYDMSGVRSSKTVNGVSYEYTTLSGKITRMTWSGNTVDIVYDDAGRPYLLQYTPSGGATQTYYYYVLNLQGDVVGLMNTSMQMVVRYSYDPWGKLTGTTATSAYVALAQANPLRYRSYCYDIETGFYYLQTRYYDPTIARFINADGYLSTDSTGLLSYNMFAYCENNPVMCVDQDGNSSKWWPFIRDFRYGLIHTMVQLKIQQSCTLIQTEAVTVNNKRMDLYCEQLHMVWEVKPDSKSSGVLAARMSLCKYIGNQARDCKHVPKNVVGVGPCGVFKGSFVFEYGSTKYAVWYWTPEAGVVLYDFEPIGDDETVEEYVIERLTAYASHRSVSYSPVGQYGDGGAYASSFLAAAGPAVVGAAAVGCAAALCGGRAQILNECR